MTLQLLATRMLNAAAAVVGPMPLEERAALLAEHPQFQPCSQAQLEELAEGI